MHTIHLVGGALLIAAFGWFAASDTRTPADPPPPVPPVADGHLVLVVEGDRDHLAITRAVAKDDPWAGVPKGLTSAWVLRIEAADGARLAQVPIDLSRFDTAPDRKGGAITAEGCIVHDPHVALLVNVPRFAAAANYAFVRRDARGEVPVGAATGDQVRQLTGGGR